ncbi:MAG: 50S ribosomal protein L11 methyltransferase [Eubacteriales bacterium]|nr:50S ribosomal protein L11 methyltransferase [Eubacteriales bacterium]
MNWIELSIATTEEGIEAVCARLDMLGIAQTCIEESAESVEAFLKDTAAYWDFADFQALAAKNGPCVKAYLADLPENRALVDEVKESFRALRGMDVGIDLGSLEVAARTVDEEDWANNWKAYYKPVKVGEKLFLRPSWETEFDAGGRTVVSVDPGMAFGTGTHPTTRMCMELLESCVKKGDVMLDLGCGSGILSVTALLLGAKHALAVDIDPVARKVTRENAALNGIPEESCEVLVGNLLEDETLVEKITQGYDVVCANIVASVIVALAPLVPRLLKQSGTFIASGIIEERLGEVERALHENGLATGKCVVSEGWAALRMTKL